ncbi:hypothetical protein [Vibrio sp. T11.5]|uniref:hypothetical protein n=1 Tax=Vibrio sp. T11.5 TaxID=2998836 RepID=UPI0022CD617F|nr:hypothetical protein [Vibrio sp. T11.5]MDA0120360.1 hypothetical protein [Vibrio sp. T11.5]
MASQAKRKARLPVVKSVMFVGEMDRINFLKLIKVIGIDPSAFNLNGASSDKYCLELCGDKWEVFYAERGNKNSRVEFASESDALEYLLNKLKMEPIATALKNN